MNLSALKPCKDRVSDLLILQLLRHPRIRLDALLGVGGSEDLDILLFGDCEDYFPEFVKLCIVDTIVYIRNYEYMITNYNKLRFVRRVTSKNLCADIELFYSIANRSFRHTQQPSRL